GKSVIFSSGPGGSTEGIRGPLDVVNLATILGMPANLAKDAVSLSPKRVLLKAQARRTFKAILSMPKMVPAPSSLGVVSVDDGGELVPGVGTKRSTDAARDDGAKRPRVERAEVD
ncbi:MAG: hypothetical protein TREMPRED_004018, partial [Tremellales sp. Tagirdzhanova-0007]